ncbi:MAG: N-acetylmuramoyl-L-alanine amidase [Clostridia bacterium]|nr:N-acetylmuramoyl-L-alanine amidase [Clostridia bacterium]
MPSIFLSPSLQDFNVYYDNSESEKYYMNLIADEMEPYLEATGISFTRNNPNATLAQAIRESNAGDYDLHFAIHSNASPDYLKGELTGTDFYYFTRSTRGKEAATVLADNFMSIYYNPDKVSIMPTTSLAEVSRTTAPSVLVETAYHDNPEDADWIKDNISNIARNFVQGLAEYFEIPFVDPFENETDEGTAGYEIIPNATVITQRDRLNIRRYPDINSEIIGQIPKGARVRAYCLTGEWYIIEYNGILGFSYYEYIALD